MAVFNSQFFQEAVNIVFHRILGKVQALGNFVVLGARGELPQDIQLAPA